VSDVTPHGVVTNRIPARSSIRLKFLTPPEEDVPMPDKCANNWCLTTRHHQEGKLFRLDLDIGSKSGAGDRKTEYVWLCPECALEMHPKVVIIGDTISLRLAKNPAHVGSFTASQRQAN